MELPVTLQLKQIIYVWLIGGNVGFILWAGALYVLRRPSGPLFFRISAFLQLLVVFEIVLGLIVFADGMPTNWGHVLYALLNGFLALARLLWHGRLAGMGRRGLLWHMFMAVLAIGLIARSSVTAGH